MFNLFRKKEKQQSPEEMQQALWFTMLGYMEPYDWPEGHEDCIPWSLFSDSRPESRHYWQARYFLSKPKVYPLPEQENRVYGVIMDVCLEEGTEYVAAYADHRARYVNHTGGWVFRDAPDSSMNDPIDSLLAACQVVANQIQPLENALPNPPKDLGAVQICIPTPGGIRHGSGTFEGWAQNPTGAPIVAAVTSLMKSLVDKQIALK